MGFGVLFVMLLAVAGWWLHSRWAALRDARDARREAEMMFVMEARAQVRKPVEAPPASPAAPSEFNPTLPGKR